MIRPALVAVAALVAATAPLRAQDAPSRAQEARELVEVDAAQRRPRRLRRPVVSQPEVAPFHENVIVPLEHAGEVPTLENTAPRVVKTVPVWERRWQLWCDRAGPLAGGECHPTRIYSR